LAVSLTSPIRDAVLPENRQLQNIREHVENIRNDLFDDESTLKSIRDEIQNKKPAIIFENEQYLNLQKRYSNSLEYIKGHENEPTVLKRQEIPN
jgi:hypothetical protein